MCNASQPEDQAVLRMGMALPFLYPITGWEFIQFKGAETCVCAMTRLGTPLMTSEVNELTIIGTSSALYSISLTNKQLQ